MFFFKVIEFKQVEASGNHDYTHHLSNMLHKLDLAKKVYGIESLMLEIWIANVVGDCKCEKALSPKTVCKTLDDLMQEAKIKFHCEGGDIKIVFSLDTKNKIVLSHYVVLLMCCNLMCKLMCGNSAV